MFYVQCSKDNFKVFELFDNFLFEFNKENFKA